MRNIRYRLLAAALAAGIDSENPAKWDISSDAVRRYLCDADTMDLCLFMRGHEFRYLLPQHVKDSIMSLAHAREHYNQCAADAAAFVS